ncbi:hypothetical protein CIB48_g4258 [Xylaria polymorpha]|nr:hypothetical protein CIB48_g4258 [Xylaria polymorpha]
MESPITKIFMGDFASSTERKPIIARAAYRSADNCYRALFPCPFPWIVTKALDTAQPVITTTTENMGPSESDPAPIITPHRIPSTTTSVGVVPTQILNNDASGSDGKPSSMELLSEARVSSTHSQAVNEVKSVTGSQSLSSLLHSLLPQSLPTPLGQSSTPTPSIPPIPFQEKTSKTRSRGLSRVLPSTTTSSRSGSVDPSTPENGPGGLSAGLVAAIAVGATLAALLLLAAVAYCCLKRRTSRRGARPRARTLSQESMPHEGFDASYEWKPPVELPHLNKTSRRAELEDSPTLRAQLDDASSFQATPSSPSATSSLGPRNAAEMLSPPPRPPRPSSAEVFVLPAELPGVYKIRG